MLKDLHRPPNRFTHRAMISSNGWPASKDRAEIAIKSYSVEGLSGFFLFDRVQILKVID